MHYRIKSRLIWSVLAICSLLLPVGVLAANTTTINVTAYIDGRDLLVIQGSTLQWHHFDFCAPGLWDGANVPTTISTTLNGTVEMSDVEWIPDWPSVYSSTCGIAGVVDFPAFSSAFTSLTPALPSAPVNVTLTPIQARGTVSIVQNPSSENGNTLIVEFNDDPEPDAATYQVQLTITPAPLKPSLSGQTTSQTEAGTLLTLYVNLTNVGTQNAQNIVLNMVCLHTLEGTGTVTLASAAPPINLGSAAVGGGATVPLQFNVPSTVTKFSVTESGTMRGSNGTTYKFNMEQAVSP
jgi:hypothetical protein